MIIVTSDWHADAVTAGVPRFKDIEAKVQSIVHAAIEGDADAVVFCGDLCDPDTPRAFAAMRLAAWAAWQLRKADIASLWLTGNHDVIEDGEGSHTLLPIAPIVQVADAPTTGTFYLAREKRLVPWLALPFVATARAYDPAVVVEAVEATDAPELIFSHLNVKGIGPGSEVKDFARGRDVFLPLDLIRRRWPKARILQGHYHTPQTFDGVEVIGSLDALTRSDAGEARGYIVLR